MRTLLSVVLLVSMVGCGPSLTELQGQRDQLERTRDKLKDELAPLELFPVSFRDENRLIIDRMIDEVRGDEGILEARDRRRAELAVVEKELKRVVTKIRIMTDPNFDPNEKPDPGPATKSDPLFRM